MEFTSKFQPSLAEETAVVQLAQVTPNPPVSVERNNFQGQLFTALPIALSLFGVIVLIWFLNTFMRICKPNEVLILSGRKHRTKDGQELGYRVIFGGRTICI
ncbi:MAG: flotillin family protein, partial [Symploca sp. SIO1C4]|nr:flotillin family protein [Symploca sp. SIO1C4]